MYLKSKVLTGMIVGVFSISSYSQNTVVKGNLPGLKSTQLVFFHSDNGKRISDTVKVNKGQFTWKTNLRDPRLIYMRSPEVYFSFFAAPGNISISGIGDSTASYVVKGSKIQDESIAFEESLKDVSTLEDNLYGQLPKADKETAASIGLKIDSLSTVRKVKGEEYISKNPSSFYSLHLLSSRADYGTDYSDIKRMYDGLDEKMKSTENGKALAERMTVLKRSALGSQMIDFTQNDTSGVPVKFSSLKGSYTLVDFWASWCGPCRAENPNVLEAYNKFKDKNFTVLGISLDESGDKWKKAIRDDKMPWVQLSDLKGWKNELSTYYGIRGIPSNFLLDPYGNIIAKDLRGEMLHKKLQELLGGAQSTSMLKLSDNP